MDRQGLRRGFWPDWSPAGMVERRDGLGDREASDGDARARAWRSATRSGGSAGRGDRPHRAEPTGRGRGGGDQGRDRSAGVGLAGWARIGRERRRWLFHLAAVAGRGAGRAAVVGAGAGDRGPVRAVLRPDRPGYAYRYYAEPPPTPVVTATIQYRGRPARGDGPAPGPGRARAAAAAPAAARAGQCTCSPTSRRPGGGPGDAGQSRLARAYARHLCRTRPGCRSVTLHVAAAPDPRPGAGPRGAREPRVAAGSTSSPRSSSPRPNGSESSRATPSERDPALPGASSWAPSGGAGTPSSSRPADPTPLGLIRVASACWRSGACWSSGSTSTTSSAPTAGPTRRRSGSGAARRWPGRSGSSSPTAAAAAGLGRLPGRAGAVHARACSAG